MSQLFDTITAIATAPGEAAIGIIRVSGPETMRILNRIFRSRTQGEVGLQPWKVHYGQIHDQGKVLDEVLVLYFGERRSYTGESMAEIHCHGGALPLRNVLKTVLASGARLAEPGEFTKRAFLNGRIDLAQAESIMDLIQSKTDKGFDQAMDQLNGRLSKKIGSVRVRALEMLAHLAVNIDYPEEDIEEIGYDELLEGIGYMKAEVDQLLSHSRSGRIIREGLRVAIVGRPNVGKSSLLNALLQEERAIVTDIPGTTRDVIEEYLNVKGIPVRIMDTAGIRDTEDQVERIGVTRSRESLQMADLVLTVLNSSEALQEDDRQLLTLLSEKQVILILNKSDLEQQLEEEELKRMMPHVRIIRTSVVSEMGLEALENEILRMVSEGEAQSSEASYVSNARHIALLEACRDRLEELLRSVETRVPYDFIEMDLRSAHDLLGEVVGETVSEDLLDKIFGQFCLGK